MSEGTETNWHDPKDVMPKERVWFGNGNLSASKIVLVTIRINELKVKRVLPAMTINGKWEFLSPAHELLTSEIIAWMELPEPCEW